MSAEEAAALAKSSAAALAPGWSAAQDKSGATYYFHSDGSSTWSLEEAAAGAGAERAGNAASGELPAGWTEHHDNDGDSYYSHEGGEVTWKRP